MQSGTVGATASGSDRVKTSTTDRWRASIGLPPLLQTELVVPMLLAAAGFWRCQRRISKGEGDRVFILVDCGPS